MTAAESSRDLLSTMTSSQVRPGGVCRCSRHSRKRARSADLLHVLTRMLTSIARPHRSLRGLPLSQQLVEVGDRVAEAFGKRCPGSPAERTLGERGIGLALARIIRG